MSWDYRVIRHKKNDRYHYYIHEVYYDDEGNPESVTEEPVYPYGESFDEFKNDCKYFMKALKEPVLDYDMFDEIKENENE